MQPIVGSNEEKERHEFREIEPRYQVRLYCRLVVGFIIIKQVLFN